MSINSLYNFQDKRHQTLQYVHHILHLLPAMTCWSPKDSLELLQGNENNGNLSIVTFMILAISIANYFFYFNR